MPILYSIVVLLLSINVLFGLQRAVNFASTSVFASNIPQTPVSDSQNQEVAGVAKKSQLPKNLELTPPQLSAASAIALDLDSRFVFFAKNPDLKVPIASTTKIMTALVALEQFQQDDVLVARDVAGFDGSSMGIRIGERLTVRSLLYGMLLNSGNDASYVLASNYPGGVSKFVAAMNQKVGELGLTNTRFDNPAGFDNSNHYSSASDLSKIAVEAYKNETFAAVVATKDAVVTSEDKTVVHQLKNLNKLLSLPGVVGVKTGYTYAAKENLVGLLEKDGRKVLTVVLGSNDRFGETKGLLDWVSANFTWEQ